MDEALLKRLEICRKCEKRKFGDNGIVCSLTDVKPSFDWRCSHFEMDDKAAKRANAATSYKEVKEEQEKNTSKSVWWIIGFILVIIRLIIRLAGDYR